MSSIGITPEELVRRIEGDEELQVLDVRAEHRLASGRVDLVPDERFFNRRGSVLVEMEDFSATEGEFRDWVNARAGAFPDHYRHIKAINIGLVTVDDSEADELEAGRKQTLSDSAP